MMERFLIEGCYPDTPRRLTFAEFNLDVPKNAQLLKMQDGVRVIKYRIYRGTDHAIDSNVDGYQLDDRLKWIFDAVRAVIGRERIYIQKDYIEHPDWKIYSERAFQHFKIVQRDFFGRNRNIDEINEIPYYWA